MAIDPDLVPILDAITDRLDALEHGAFNVRTYGATGDGTTDDTSAVQDAIDACQANGGGVVAFPPGTYLTSGIRVDGGWQNGIEIRGSGFDSTAIIAAPGTTGPLLGLTGGYIHAHDMWLRGAGQPVEALLKVGDTLNGCARSTFERLYLTETGAGGHGILIEGGSATTSHGNHWSNIRMLNLGGTGFLVGPHCFDQIVSNMWIGEAHTGIDLQTGSNYFTNTHVWSATSGPNVQIASDGNGFANCYIESSDTGWGAVVANTAQQNRFTGCRIWRNASGGILINDNDNTVTGCNLHENIGPAVQITDAVNNVIVGNTFSDYAADTQTHCVRTTGTADRSTVVGNNFTGGYTTTPLELAGQADVIAHNATGTNRNSGDDGDRTLAVEDLDRTIEFRSFTTPATLTIPPTSTERFPLGTKVLVINYGDENVTIAGGAGVTIRSTDPVIRDRFGWAILEHRFDNDWHMLT